MAAQRAVYYFQRTRDLYEHAIFLCVIQIVNHQFPSCLIAGRRAKVSTAHDSALSYFSAGSALLMEDRWTRRYDLAFTLELNWAACEFLTGHHEAADERLSVLADRAANHVDRAAVTCLKLELYTMHDRSDRAVAVCLEYLREEEGVEWSAHPTDQAVRHEPFKE